MSLTATLRATAAAIRAEAEARATTLETLADAADVAHDGVLTMDEAAAVARTTPRAHRDAGRRQELAIVYAGRHPRVRRSELDRWLATHRVQSAPIVDDPREEARLAVEAAAARAARASGRQTIGGGVLMTADEAAGR